MWMWACVEKRGWKIGVQVRVRRGLHEEGRGERGVLGVGEVRQEHERDGAFCGCFCALFFARCGCLVGLVGAFALICVFSELRCGFVGMLLCLFETRKVEESEECRKGGEIEIKVFS